MFALLMVWTCLSPTRHSIGHTRAERTPGRLRALVIATIGYKTEYHEWPELAPDIFHPLYDSRFLEPGSIAKDQTDRAIDLWGNPYQFVGIIDEIPRFYSIGPDGIDQSGTENSDDIVSRR